MAVVCLPISEKRIFFTELSFYGITPARKEKNYKSPGSCAWAYARCAISSLASAATSVGERATF